MTAIVPVRTSIAAGQALSGPVASVGYGVCLLLLPAAWTDAPLTLQGSLDEGEPAAWADLHDHLGNEVVLMVAAGRALTLPPTLLLGWRWLRLRSGPCRRAGEPGRGAPSHPRHPAARMTALFQHYLPPVPTMLPYVSGRFYASQHARAVGGAVAMTANRLFCVPYMLARPGLFSAMAVSVTTGAAGLLRMALAADNGSGRPGAVIEEPVADADTTTVGSAICSFAQPRWIPAGVWWLLLCFSGAPSVRGTSTQAFSGGNTLLLGSAAADGGAGGGTGSENGFFAALTHQAGVPIMPNPPDGLSYLVNAATPLPTLRAA